MAFATRRDGQKRASLSERLPSIASVAMGDGCHCYHQYCGFRLRLSHVAETKQPEVVLENVWRTLQLTTMVLEECQSSGLPIISTLAFNQDSG